MSTPTLTHNGEFPYTPGYLKRVLILSNFALAVIDPIAPAKAEPSSRISEVLR